MEMLAANLFLFGSTQGVAILGFLAALLQVAGYYIYLRDSDIEPNPTSWLMFAYGTTILSLLEYDNRASVWELLLPLVCSILSIAVAARIFVRAALISAKPKALLVWPKTRWDQLALCGDLLITLFYVSAWLLSKNELTSGSIESDFSLILLVASNITNLTSFLPILRSTYLKPANESFVPWTIWTFAYSMLLLSTILSGDGYTLLALYPLMCALLHGSIAVLSSLPKFSSRQSYAEIKDQKSQSVGATDFLKQQEFLVINKSKIHFTGLHTTLSFSKGQRIATIFGQATVLTHDEMRHRKYPFVWIGLEGRTYINTSDSLWRFVNHSCNPNVFLWQREVYALVDISPGEELTMDYSLSDADPYWIMNCNCGSNTCRSRIGSIHSLSVAKFRKVQPHIHPIFAKIFVDFHGACDEYEYSA